MFLHRAREAFRRRRGHRGYEQLANELEQRQPQAGGNAGLQGFTWNSFLSGLLAGFIQRGRVQPTPQRWKK